MHLPLSKAHLFCSHLLTLPSRYSTTDRLKCMVSSLPHFSHAPGLKDKDGLCSEGLIDQNNCASICLLKAERTTASQRLCFHQLAQPLMLLTRVVLMCCRTALHATNMQLWCPKIAYLCAKATCAKYIDSLEGGTKKKNEAFAILQTARCDQCKNHPPDFLRLVVLSGTTVRLSAVLMIFNLQ